MIASKTLAVLALGGVTALAVPTNVASRSELESARAFGRAVAIAGDFAFVGEPNVGGGGGRGGGRGAAGAAPGGVVHVYRLTTGVWRKVDSLISPNSFPSDGFGSTLVADGTTLLVGQVQPPPGNAAAGGRGGGGGGGGGGGRAGGGAGAGGAAAPLPPPADTATGSVYVYRREATMKWVNAGTLSAPKSGGAQFGSALALDVAGGIALVGAPGESSGGMVHVFRLDRTQWTAAGTLPAQGLAPADRFGAAIAVNGKRAVVGAPSRRGKGTIFAFMRGADGSWTQETEQAAPANLPDNAQFGAAVEVAGDRIIAGAPGVNFTPTAQPNPQRDSLIAALIAAPPGAARDAIVAQLSTAGGRGGRGGAGGGGGGGGGRGGAQIGLGTGMVVTYDRASFGTWRMTGTLAPFDFGNVSFGSTLQAVGDELWIGAPGSDGMGRIYRTRMEKDGGWSTMTKLGIDSVESGALWGAAFAVSGDGAIVGMPGDGSGGGTVAFLGRSVAGAWNVRTLAMPPIVEAYAAMVGKETKCSDGKVREFDCSNTSVAAYLPLSALGARRGVRLSGSWGWTDPVTGHDIAIIGRTDGTAFVDVTIPERPRYLGDLMRTKGATMSSWREIKTYKNYALIVSDGSGDRHGIQIFDLTRLRNVTTPRHFNEDAHFDAGSIHDIAVNQESGFVYAVGTANGGERCGGGSVIIDIKTPLKPQFVGCFADVGTGRSRTGYTHDILCVMYKGPDARYKGKEICMASNETTVSIQDVTDKKNIKVLSHATYPSVAYTHQGWFTEDQKYWFLNDELDEGSGTGKAAQGTRTMIFNVADLHEPVLVKEYIGPTRATDHNLYVKGDRMYQSNYQAGLRILDISDPENPKEVGYFDTTPGENTPSMSGSWNNYPFFKNGVIGVNSTGEGFFVVRDLTKKITP